MTAERPRSPDYAGGGSAAAESAVMCILGARNWMRACILVIALCAVPCGGSLAQGGPEKTTSLGDLFHRISTAQRCSIVADSYWLMRHRKLPEVSDYSTCDLDKLAGELKCTHEVKNGVHVFRSRSWFIERRFEPDKGILEAYYQMRKRERRVSPEALVFAVGLEQLPLVAAAQDFPELSTVHTDKTFAFLVVLGEMPNDRRIKAWSGDGATLAFSEQPPAAKSWLGYHLLPLLGRGPTSKNPREWFKSYPQEITLTLCPTEDGVACKAGVAFEGATHKWDLPVQGGPLPVESPAQSAVCSVTVHPKDEKCEEDPLARRVDLDVRDETIKDFLEALSRETGLSFAIATGSMVREKERLTYQARGLSLREVLRGLDTAFQWSWRYEVDHGRYSLDWRRDAMEVCQQKIADAYAAKFPDSDTRSMEEKTKDYIETMIEQRDMSTDQILVGTLTDPQYYNALWNPANRTILDVFATVDPADRDQFWATSRFNLDLDVLPNSAVELLRYIFGRDPAEGEYWFERDVPGAITLHGKWRDGTAADRYLAYPTTKQLTPANLKGLWPPG